MKIELFDLLILSSLCVCALAAHGLEISQNNEINTDNIFNKTSVISLERQRASLPPLGCDYAPGLIVGSRTWELECCADVVRLYNFQWYSVSRSLTLFLETLRQWNCPQFEEQCQKRVFAFTSFSELIYDYFCNYTTVIEACLPQVVSTVTRVQQRLNKIGTSFSVITKFDNTSEFQLSTEPSINVMTWKRLVSFIQPSLMTIEELKEPCIEIAQYDIEQVHDGGYQELITLLVPTCELSWCGFSAETFQHHRISFWTCLTSK